MPAPQALTPARGRYLRLIYTLCQTGRPVRQTQIAAALGVSKASVSRMAGLLCRDGLLEKRPGGLALTPPGEQLGKKLQQVYLCLQQALAACGAPLLHTPAAGGAAKPPFAGRDLSAPAELLQMTAPSMSTA